MSYYYIHINGAKDGPHDLVTIMRRIRTGKINKETLISIGIDDAPQSAAEIPDIALFFSGTKKTSGQSSDTTSLTFFSLLAKSWRFLSEHHYISVYSGGMVLVTMMFGSGLFSAFDLLTGAMFTWVIFATLHNVYLLYILRLRRGQTTGSDFINRHLAPVLPTVIATSIVLGLMMTGGLLLFVLPGMAVAVMYVFAPFLILDHRYGIAQALSASRLLMQKRGRRYISLLVALTLLHFICLLLIAPIPLTLPLFAFALAEIYDELCTG